MIWGLTRGWRTGAENRQSLSQKLNVILALIFWSQVVLIIEFPRQVFTRIGMIKFVCKVERYKIMQNIFLEALDDNEIEFQWTLEDFYILFSETDVVTERYTMRDFKHLELYERRLQTFDDWRKVMILLWIIWGVPLIVHFTFSINRSIIYTDDITFDSRLSTIHDV